MGRGTKNEGYDHMMTKIKRERERDRVTSVLHLLHHNRKKYIINSLAIIVFNLIQFNLIHNESNDHRNSHD